MAGQYWIGDFFIDLSRNQITQKAQSQTIPPKALAVLTYLAKNANRVVSHDELLSAVWPDTVVTPNTLQRSIAQLRKALGGNNQYQSYIKTHAKQGYSLEVEVRWQESSGAVPLIEKPGASDIEVADESTLSEIKPADTNLSKTAASETTTSEANAKKTTVSKITSPRSALRLLAIFTGIAFICFIGVKLLTPKPALNFSLAKLHALTSTDDKEFASIYSPDGQYVVFHRYSQETCLNTIWAKNTKTQREIQLTKNMDTYGSHSFSKDGKSLVFIQTEDCEEPVTQKKCYKLMSLDFKKALESPQSPRLMMECKHSEIRKPSWLNNDNIALLQKSSDRWKLISYSENDNNSQVIYEIDGGNLIDYDYSVTDDLIALTSIHNDGLYYIDVLKSDGQLVSSHRIKYPKEIANLRFIYPNFSPQDSRLIFSTGRQLFTLSYEGTVMNISLPLDQPMGTPTFHPDGKRMLVIKGHYDSDIVSIPLSKLSTETELSIKNENYSVIERSIVAENIAIFQPSGDLIAYSSKRSGESQIWITDGKDSYQLSHFPMDSYINAMDWAADGQSILVNVNYELTQVFLDGSVQSFKLENRVEKLFQWDSKNQTALVIMRLNGILKFAELNLTDLEVRIINDKTINWALKSDNGRLVYTDHLDRFWLSGAVEDLYVEALDGQGSDKRFVIKDNIIYGVNDDFQLWSYALNEGAFEIIGDITNNLDNLTDINETQLLMTVRVSGRKEVAEFILAD